MTDIYQVLRRFGKDKILEIGSVYAIDKPGFEKFINEKWEDNRPFSNKNESIRALVAIAVLLNDRPFGYEHELNLLDSFFNHSIKDKSLLEYLDTYFNEARIFENGFDIVKAYKNKIAMNIEVKTLAEQLKVLGEYKINPLLTSDYINNLKKYNNTQMFVTTVSGGKLTTRDKLQSVVIQGNDAQNLILKFKNTSFKFANVKRAVSKLENRYHEVIYFNPVLSNVNSKYTELEKMAYTAGFENAQKYARELLSNRKYEQDLEFKKAKQKPTLKEILGEREYYI